MHPFHAGDVLELAGRRIEVLSALHTVPAVGFAVFPGPHEAAGRAWVFTGDTAPEAALWDRLQTLPTAILVVETAFSNDEHLVADISRHLHPASLGRQLQRIAPDIDVYITHIKPGELDPVMSEIGALGDRHRIHALVAGQVMSLG